MLGDSLCRDSIQAMSLVRKSILIEAPIDKVFGTVADIEGIARFSGLIAEISRQSDNSYHWRVELAGVSLEWDAVVTRKETPGYLSWRSVNGVENRGESAGGAKRPDKGGFLHGVPFPFAPG